MPAKPCPKFFPHCHASQQKDTNMKTEQTAPASRLARITATTALWMMFIAGAQARTWTSADGTQTFEGELKAYDQASGLVTVTMQSGKAARYHLNKFSADDKAFIVAQSLGETLAAPETPTPAATPAAAPAAVTAAGPGGQKVAVDTQGLFKRHDGKPADMSKPVQVFVLLGQSNMVGLGKIPSLQEAVKSKSKYPYLVEDDGSWTQRKDVRNVYIMSLKLQHNDWLSVTNRKNVGLEQAIGHAMGNALDAPVMILKSCIGNRSLGWDLLPPGTEPYESGGKLQPGYRGTPDNPKGNGEKVEGQWYAGKQYDDDLEGAKQILADLQTYYPGAKSYEIAGFFFWQGEKDNGNGAHQEFYERNLVAYIKALRKDFNAPNAKFVLATLGESKKDSGNKVMEGHFAVDGKEGKHPEFKGNVSTVYSNPLSMGGSGNGHYGGNAETYMNVGEAMGAAMVELLKK